MEEPYVTLRHKLNEANKALSIAQSTFNAAKKELESAVARCLHTYNATYDYVPHMVTDRDPMSGYVSGPRHEEGLYRRVEVKTCTRCGDVKK